MRHRDILLPALAALVVLTILGLLSGCPNRESQQAPQTTQQTGEIFAAPFATQIKRVHDNTNGVTCYVYRGIGISCVQTGFEETEP